MELLPNPPEEEPSRVVNLRLARLAAKHGVSVEDLKRQIAKEIGEIVAAENPLHVVKEQEEP
jgi:hypothetical protein